MPLLAGLQISSVELKWKSHDGTHRLFAWEVNGGLGLDSRVGSVRSGKRWWAVLGGGAGTDGNLVIGDHEEDSLLVVLQWSKGSVTQISQNANLIISKSESSPVIILDVLVLELQNNRVVGVDPVRVEVSTVVFACSRGGQSEQNSQKHTGSHHFRRRVRCHSSSCDGPFIRSCLPPFRGLCSPRWEL